MPGPAPLRVRAGGHQFHVRADADPPWARRLVIGIALTFFAIVLLVPLGVVFATAFRDGVGAYWSAINDADTFASIRLTALVVVIVVPLNVAFGLAAAWAIARFPLRGKGVLLTIIDLPFAVSPVIAGMMLVLLLGGPSLLGPWLSERGLQLMFAPPAIILASLFVTLPLVARELIPALEARGPEQELAALSLGATGWQTFWRVTVPNLKWALFFGAVLCAARAVGEFGAVSVVSGHIRGETNTMPLHVEILYNEYRYQAAFAVATLLVLVAVATLLAKTYIEWRAERGGNTRDGAH